MKIPMTKPASADQQFFCKSLKQEIMLFLILQALRFQIQKLKPLSKVIQILEFT